MSQDASNIAAAGSNPAVAGPAGSMPITDANSQTTAAAGASSNLSSTTTLKSLEDFKKQAPEVYNKMMQGIAMTIVNTMKHHQERLKEMWRKATQDSQG